MSASTQKIDQAIWQVVTKIQPGQIMSYGLVARVAGFPRHARMVSKAMSRSPQPLPWYRVVKSDHRLAFEPGSEAYNKQKSLLEEEGVHFIKGKAIPVEKEEADLDWLLWGPVDGKGD